MADSYGVPLGLLPADTQYQMEVQRAPDASGSADEANATTLATVPGTQEVLVDPLPNDNAARWYRCRHVRDGYLPSAWTAWFKATPQKLAAQYSRVPWTPKTSLAVRDESAVVKHVSLSSTPVGSTIYWRETTNGGTTAWVGTKDLATRRYDLEVTGKVTLEYYAEFNGVKEPTQQTVVDPDVEPAITGGDAIENPANYVNIDLALDDDTVHWSVWARRVNAGGAAAWPRLSGSQTPDDDFLKLYRSGDLTGRFNFKASTGDWYLIVRAYGSKGQWVEWTKMVPVAGTAATVGNLSNLAAVVDANYDTKLTWDHNGTAGDGTHKVAITEDDVAVITLTDSRDPQTDTDGTNTVLGSGGVIIVRNWVDPATAGAKQITRNYVVQLYKGTSFVTSYPLSLTGYVTDESTGAPTETPGTPATPTWNGVDFVTSWSNTSESHQVEVEWEEGDGTSATYTTHLKSAGSTSDLLTPQSGSTRARARARYKNTSGTGPWSAWSSFGNK